MSLTKMQHATARGMLNAAEAASRCGLTARIMLRMAKRRQIPAYRFNGRIVRFKHSDVDAFIERARS
jgi:excisionase family DNA binding protein